MEIEAGLESRMQVLVEGYPHSLPHHLGIRLLVLGRERLVAEMPVDNRTKQPFGILHGGASVVLAETLASIGGWLNLERDDEAAVGLEINANHLRAVDSGMVRGTAVPLHRGRRTQVWEIRVENDAGKLVCVSRCTLAVTKR
ncbi:MAG: hotdog fold thioesterase [Bdellovibrionales bacterium]|nr:hotdog fold thioesterase [Bdellovibrionales bacterium]